MRHCIEGSRKTTTGSCAHGGFGDRSGDGGVFYIHWLEQRGQTIQ